MSVFLLFFQPFNNKCISSNLEGDFSISDLIFCLSNSINGMKIKVSTTHVIAANIYTSNARGLDNATIGCKETNKRDMSPKIIPLT